MQRGEATTAKSMNLKKNVIFCKKFFKGMCFKIKYRYNQPQTYINVSTSKAK
jgi:hypothetical protein